MARTIHPGDPHREVQSLLPWYVTDRLDAAEKARVEVHLAQCPQCQADERLERRLEAELAGLPVRLDQDWTKVRRRLKVRPAAAADRPPSVGARLARAWDGSPAWVRWSVASPFIALLILALAWPTAPPRARRAAGPTPPGGQAGLTVTFRPDTREAELSAAVRQVHGRIVDGPGGGDAWVVRVPATERAAALTALRQRPSVLLVRPAEEPAGS